MSKEKLAEMVDEMFTTSDFEALRGQLFNQYLSNCCYIEFAQLAASTKITFPEKFSGIIAPMITRELRERMIKYMDKAAMGMFKIELLLGINVLFPKESGLPEKTSETMYVEFLTRNFNLDQDLISKLKDSLDNSRSIRSWRDTVRLAMFIKIHLNRQC